MDHYSMSLTSYNLAQFCKKSFYESWIFTYSHLSWDENITRKNFVPGGIDSKISISGGVGIKTSWCEKILKINKQGGTTIPDSRVRILENS